MVGGAERIFIAGRLCLVFEDSSCSTIHVVVIKPAVGGRDKSGLSHPKRKH